MLSSKRRSAWKELTPFTWYCCVSFALGDLLFGIDTGSFGSLQALPSWLRRFGVLEKGVYVLPTKRQSIMNSVPFLGKVAGTIMFEPIVERVGYKIVAYIVAAIQIVAVIVEMSTHNWIVFSVGRVLGYLATGLIENVVISYLSEIAPAPLRGFFAGSYQILVTLGNTWGGGMSRAYATETTDKGWLVPIGVQMIPAVLLILLIPWTVESPRWLIQHGKSDRALKHLDRLRTPEATASGRTLAEMQAIEQAIADAHAQGNQTTWFELFDRKHFRRSMVAAWAVFFQETSGNQWVASYAATFYKAQGLGANSFTYSNLAQVAGLVGSIVMVSTVDILGRRPLLIMGTALSAIFLYVTGALATKPHPTIPERNMIVAGLILVNFVVKASISTISYTLAGEIGGVRLRKKTIGFALSVDVASAFLVTFATPYIQADIGAHVAYIVAGSATFACFFCTFFVPELKNRSLEEVDELFERNLWAWQFKDAQCTGIGSVIARLELSEAVPKALTGEEEVRRQDEDTKNVSKHVEEIQV